MVSPAFSSPSCVPVSFTLPTPRSQLRPRINMTAIQPSRLPDNFLQSDIDPIPIQQDDPPVYCYVACSPLRSDYLERVLTSRVYDVVTETPAEPALVLSDRLQNSITLKREDTTDVKSFKVRGAYNMMANADPTRLAAGVVAASAGNHAQGVALAAQVLDVPATIIMPAVTPQIKIDAVRRRGATAILHGDNFDEAKGKALEIAAKEGKMFIPPFDNPDIIAGQGTVGLELMRQLKNIDAIFVPVGGGGLLAGIATVVKRLRPQVKIIGVEPVGACAMYKSLQSGQREKLSSVSTFADGVAVVEVGEETFRLCKDLVDEIVLVTNDEICAAIKDMFEDTRSILEPAGALSVAGVKAWVEREGVINKDLVAITSGANTNFDVLRHVSERAEIGEGREGVMAITIPEHPGAFCELINILGSQLNITEFNYRHNGGKEAHVYVGVRVMSRDAMSTILERVNSSEMSATDLTDNEMAKLHVRHLVGGAALNSNEAVYRFEFPERPGALLKFLVELPAGLNITMFHYRNYGGDVGRVLVGLNSVDDLPKAEETSMLKDFVDRLGYRFVREDDNVAYKFFLGKQ